MTGRSAVMQIRGILPSRSGPERGISTCHPGPESSHVLNPPAHPRGPRRLGTGDRGEGHEGLPRADRGVPLLFPGGCEMSKIPVAVLGATGNIGQRFVSLLQDHPDFDLAVLCSSERKVGGRLADSWRLEDVPLGPDVAGMKLAPLQTKALPKAGVVAAFSALPAEIAR